MVRVDGEERQSAQRGRAGTRLGVWEAVSNRACRLIFLTLGR